MNNASDASTTLQHYAPGMYSILADIVLTAFLFGCLTVLCVVSTWHLIHRGVKQPSTMFMLASIFLLYASTATYFAAKTAYVVAHGRLLNDAVAALEPTSPPSNDTALIQFGQCARRASYIMGAVIAINITLGDIIVWWRVRVLWRSKSIMALGLILIVGTFVLGTMSTILFRVDVEVQPLFSYGDIYGGISALLSLISNVLATSLIGRKAWEHRKILRLGLGASKGRWNTPTMKALTLLVESGSVYSVLFCGALINNVMVQFKPSLTPSAGEYLSLATVFLTGCFVPILAIYPTLIIFIVALNRSEIDGALANATPNDISTSMLPSLLFRRSSSAVHLSRSIDHPTRTECPFDSPEGQSREEQSLPPAQGMSEGSGHLAIV